MSVCSWCKREMASGVSCTVETFTDMGDAPFQRIPYGDDREGWGDLNRTPPPNCHDCAAPVGGLHHPGCDMERCPRCGGQAITCDCTGET